MRAVSAAVRVWCMNMVLSMYITPVAAQAVVTSCASAAVGATGFSERMCLPAAAALRAQAVRCAVGIGRYTASTSGSARISSYEP